MATRLLVPSFPINVWFLLADVGSGITAPYLALCPLFKTNFLDESIDFSLYRGSTSSLGQKANVGIVSMAEDILSKFSPLSPWKGGHNLKFHLSPDYP